MVFVIITKCKPKLDWIPAIPTHCSLGKYNFSLAFELKLIFILVIKKKLLIFFPQGMKGLSRRVGSMVLEHFGASTVCDLKGSSAEEKFGEKVEKFYILCLYMFLKNNCLKNCDKGLVTFSDETNGFPRHEGYFQDCRFMRRLKCGDVIQRAQKVALLARALCDQH